MQSSDMTQVNQVANVRREWSPHVSLDYGFDL